MCFYKEDINKAYWYMFIRSKTSSIYVESNERLVYACIGIEALALNLDMTCCFMQIHQ